MREYIYFVASLPSVWMDKPAPISYREFLEKAGEQLVPEDYAELRKAVFSHDGGKSKYRIIKDWDGFNHVFSELLVEERAKRKGMGDLEKYKAKCEGDRRLQQRAREIVAITDPLEAEKAILGEYFSFLKSHPVSSPFSMEALIIYGLELQIKERESSFLRDKGRAEFDSLYSEISSAIAQRSDYGL